MKTAYRQSKAKQPRLALTLIEVLVVIAILAVLAAMILPYLSGGGQSISAHCMSNEKQIAIAAAMYAQDSGSPTSILCRETTARPR
jgi:prepilin-type N-terminal cleavage/methylation domain-containing protein